jgi:16S rRNA (adenine1518-N6/adenine1519-N6)-dimethyltransferase
MSTIDNLPPLRDVITTHELRARKSLGQNFLLDLNLTAKIARQAGDLTGCDVLEIGPGPGGLTRGLLSEGARRVLAIEKDPRCMPALAEIAAAYPGRLQVIEGDALDIDPLAHLTPPIRVAANLPYNVGTELLVRWLTPKDWPPYWQSLTLMFQREVAQRIVAEPRFPAEAAVLNRVVAAAFNQRRKMLRAALKGVAPDIEDRLHAAGIKPTERAEQVSLEGFCALARAVAAP